MQENTPDEQAYASKQNLAWAIETKERTLADTQQRKKEAAVHQALSKLPLSPLLAVIQAGH